MNSGVVHISGVHVQIGTRLRQRCAWCGGVLLEYDLANIAVPVGSDPTPPTWEPGRLVLVDDGMSASIAHVDGEDLPDNACALLDPAVTA